MCDDLTLSDNEKFLSASLNRRKFGKAAGAGIAAASVAAGMSALWSGALNAQEAAALSGRDVMVKTPDGEADCFFVHPTVGKHAAVILWPDIWGLRPAKRQMAVRLAASGYAVIVINQFYRDGRAPFLNEELRGTAEGIGTMRQFAGKLSPETNMMDARALVAFLDAQEAVDTGRKIGSMGYCMGGPMTMRTAAAVPDRIGAGATFHSGALITDAADSPHLLLPTIKADFLIATAENDHERRPEEAQLLREAFAAHNLSAEVEVYKGALHGWCPPDSRVYNQVQAERAWSRMLALYEKALA